MKHRWLDVYAEEYSASVNFKLNIQLYNVGRCKRICIRRRSNSFYVTVIQLARKLRIQFWIVISSRYKFLFPVHIEFFLIFPNFSNFSNNPFPVPNSLSTLFFLSREKLQFSISVVIANFLIWIEIWRKRKKVLLTAKLDFLSSSRSTFLLDLKYMQPFSEQINGSEIAAAESDLFARSLSRLRRFSQRRISERTLEERSVLLTARRQFSRSNFPPQGVEGRLVKRGREKGGWYLTNLCSGQVSSFPTSYMRALSSSVCTRTD